MKMTAGLSPVTSLVPVPFFILLLFYTEDVSAT